MVNIYMTRKKNKVSPEFTVSYQYRGKDTDDDIKRKEELRQNYINRFKQYRYGRAVIRGDNEIKKNVLKTFDYMRGVNHDKDYKNYLIEKSKIGRRGGIYPIERY